MKDIKTYNALWTGEKGKYPDNFGCFAWPDLDFFSKIHSSKTLFLR